LQGELYVDVLNVPQLVQNELIISLMVISPRCGGYLKTGWPSTGAPEMILAG